MRSITVFSASCAFALLLASCVRTDSGSPGVRIYSDNAPGAVFDALLSDIDSGKVMIDDEVGFMVTFQSNRNRFNSKNMRPASISFFPDASGHGAFSAVMFAADSRTASGKITFAEFIRNGKSELTHLTEFAKRDFVGGGKPDAPPPELPSPGRLTVLCGAVRKKIDSGIFDLAALKTVDPAYPWILDRLKAVRGSTKLKSSDLSLISVSAADNGKIIFNFCIEPLVARMSPDSIEFGRISISASGVPDSPELELVSFDSASGRVVDTLSIVGSPLNQEDCAQIAAKTLEHLFEMPSISRKNETARFIVLPYELPAGFAAGLDSALPMKFARLKYDGFAPFLMTLSASEDFPRGGFYYFPGRIKPVDSKHVYVVGAGIVNFENRNGFWNVLKFKKGISGWKIQK